MLACSAPKESCGGELAFERWFELHGKAQSTHELQTVNFPLTDALKLALGQARWEGLLEEEKKVKNSFFDEFVGMELIGTELTIAHGKIILLYIVAPTIMIVLAHLHQRQ